MSNERQFSGHVNIKNLNKDPLYIKFMITFNIQEI